LSQTCNFISPIEEKPLSAKAAKRARQKQRKVCNANRIKLINIRISYFAIPVPDILEAKLHH
jgi:hypothetical protein